MEDVLIPLIVVPTIFIGMPWLIFHYVTKWKQAPKITEQDERLLDEMHQLSRRLEDRLQTVERIIAADNPDWRPGLTVPEQTDDRRLDYRDEPRRTDETFGREGREPYRPEYTRIERSN